ncbi:MAG: sodium bicarbonate transporter family protein, partial [Actinobacteria bacterium]|nr:sodium bicarbonate transporter family protein [Actinomycetota bacterium]
NWKTELVAAASSGTFLNVITGSIAGLLSALLLLIAMILYPVSYAIFTILYALYGTILYTTGPLVLALLPTMGLGSLARRYAINFMIFGAWGLIYAVFCRLAVALNISSMAAITGAGNLGGLLTGAAAEVLLAAASILFSVCILLIPFLAKRIVEGDLGSTMLTVLGTAAAMAQAAVATASGAADGFGRSASSSGGAESAGTGSAVPSGAPPAPPPPSGSGQAVGGTATPQTGAPSGPRQSTGSIGQHRPVNIPHAVGWLAGAAAALGVQGGQRVVQAGRGLAARAVAPTRNSDSA